ncbi:MAG: ABC transporter substrate-binding protein [Polyangiaceae bacterium]
MSRNPRGRRVVRFALLLLPGALSVISCNALVDTDVEQCQTTDDCVAKGPAFAGSVCSPDKICTLGGDCTSNQECIDRFEGQLAICRQPDRVCVTLKSQDCKQVFPEDAVSEEGTIVLGFMGALEGEFIGNGLPMWEGVQLAVNQLDTFAKGLPLPDGVSRRRLAFVACHDLDDPVRAASHLVQTLKVPAIVGPGFSGVTLDVAKKVSIPGGTLLISPSATSTAITDLQDNGLVWRTAPSDALQAIPLAQLVSDVEANVRKARGLAQTDSIRVSVAVKSDAYGLGLATAVLEKVKFNGKSALDPANSTFFLRQDYPDPSEQPSFDFDKGVVQPILTFKPDILLALGTTETVTRVLDPVEAGASGNKPVYILADGGRDDALLALVDANNALAQRIVGTLPGRTTGLFAQFESEFKGFHQQKAPGSYADTAYDAAYLLAYSVVAVNDAVMTGAKFNDGLKKMVGGTKVSAGTTGINQALSLLQEKKNIDYDGISGPLDFDVSTGEAPADIVVWCTGLNANSVAEFKTSGQYYDALQNAVTGTRSTCTGLVGSGGISGASGTGGTSGTGGASGGTGGA